MRHHALSKCSVADSILWHHPLRKGAGPGQGSASTRAARSACAPKQEWRMKTNPRDDGLRDGSDAPTNPIKHSIILWHHPLASAALTPPLSVQPGKTGLRPARRRPRPRHRFSARARAGSVPTSVRRRCTAAVTPNDGPKTTDAALGGDAAAGGSTTHWSHWRAGPGCRR